MFQISLIPSESLNFPDHFRLEVAPPRSSASTKSSPPLVESIEPAEPPKKKSLFLFIRNLLPTRQKNVFPSTPASEPLPNDCLPVSITPPSEREHVVSSEVTKPAAPSEADCLRAAANPEVAREKSIAAPIAVPAKMPFRKSAVPPGLKRKARWNMRAAATQSTLPQTNGSSEIRPINVPDQKVSSRGPRRPAPPPHFVVSPPPDLVQALLSYAAKVSAPPRERTAPAPKTDADFDIP
jgi:hypothetical protein